MKKITTREICKFLSGLVLGDFIAGWWIYAKGLLPTSIFGVGVSQRGVVGWMVFDAIFFVFLIHYGWRLSESPKDEEQVFHRAAGVVFLAVAILHLLRLVFGWQMIIFGWHTPYWISGVGIVIAGFLSYASFNLTKVEKRV